MCVYFSTLQQSRAESANFAKSFPVSAERDRKFRGRVGITRLLGWQPVTSRTSTVQPLGRQRQPVREVTEPTRWIYVSSYVRKPARRARTVVLVSAPA